MYIKSNQINVISVNVNRILLRSKEAKAGVCFFRHVIKVGWIYITTICTFCMPVLSASFVYLAGYDARYYDAWCLIARTTRTQHGEKPVFVYQLQYLHGCSIYAHRDYP